MRYIYVILTVLILSSACNAESSPNTPPVTQQAVQPPPTAPPTTQPTSHSDETILAERDAYKEIVKAHQETLTTIKWAIGIIGTLVLALITYALFKDKKEYDNAVKGAEKACEKAEQWEEKARNTCDEIETLVKAKLVEIEKASEQKAQAVLDSIDKKAEAKLKNIGEKTQRSTQEIDAKAKKQIRITELWSDAFRLQKEGKYGAACDKYAELVKFKSDIYQIYNNWGIALSDWAMLKNDEKLFEQAGQKYAKAVEIKPDYYEAYNNWGCTLADWATLTGNEELFKEACGKYAKAVEIKPDYLDAYGNWSANLLDWARIKIGTSEYESLLKQAEEIVLKVESLKKGEGAYNLACVCALKNDKDNCKKWLLIGQEAGTLVTREHAMKDKDLESVKDEAWFKEIKWTGEK